MFKDRIEAGKNLAKKLKILKDEGKINNIVVVALPRGGIPVALEVAKELNALVDILFVKKIPSPIDEELGIGSVSENGIVYVNKDLIERLGVSENYIQEKGIEKIQEMARERQKYNLEPIMLEDKDVIIVDDGIATGSSMYLAAQSIARDLPRSIIIAAPVAPNDESVLNMLKSVSNHQEILEINDNFMSVGKWYEDFHQLSNEEIKEYIKEIKSLRV